MSTQPIKRHPRRQGAALKIAFVVMLALILAIVGGVALFINFYRASVDTDVPFDTGTLQNPDDLQNVNDQTGENTGNEYVRDKNIVNFLVAGRDKDAWNTDVMMLVNFNMNDYSISVLQIPRDTYINTDIVHGRINTAMKLFRADAYKKDSSLSGDGMMKAGMQGTVELLERSLCVQIDGYAIVNLEGFKNIINAIGGVYMNVPYVMEYEDPDQDLYINLRPGYQTLNGAQAEMFVRFRSGYVQGDIGRVNAQKIFITALFKQLKNNVNISNIATITEQLLKYVTTDLSLADVIFYAKELMKVDIENVSMMTLPGKDARSPTTGAWYYIMHRADMLEAINGYFNVFNKDITDELFDPNHIFTDGDDGIFAGIYFSEPTGADVMTADKVDGGDIDIPLLAP